MAKDPAFLFYPNDWIGGTMGMTFEEKGAYIDLLMMQFNRGHMTTDMVAHMLGHNFGQIWVKLKDKFQQDSEGLWFNARLEEEKKRRQNYAKSRRNNLSGKNQWSKSKGKKGGHKDGHMTTHMENENENENINENKKGGKGGKRSPVEVQLPWDTESFRKAWEEWKEYRRQEHGFKYKTATSQSGALSELFSLSMGNETNAIEIMRQSEANGWKGFFKLKDKNDGKTATRSGRVVRGTDYDDLKPGEIPISDIGRRSDP